MVSVNTPANSKLGSVGKPLPHVQVRVTDQQRVEIKSSSMFQGYSWVDPSACSFTEDGWLRTGDIGEFDDEGFLFITGREKNIICLPNGRNVSPEQIELEFKEQTGVNDALMFMTTDGQLAIVLSIGPLFDHQHTQDWAQQRFSEVELPQAIWPLAPDAPQLQSLYALNGPALITLQSSGGSTQRVGLMGGTNQFQGNGNGLVNSAIVDPNNTLNVQGPNLGAYWSLTGANGWHVDLTASGGRVNGYSLNDQGQRQAAEGSAMTLSVQGGFPIGISENWVIEPQAELINQRISLDTPYAGSGNASSTDLTSWSGRVGASLKGSYDIKGLPIEPYVRTNFWHTVNTSDTVTLGQVDKLSSSRNASSIELGLGLVARVTPSVSLYVSGDYNSASVNNDLYGLIGSLGVRMRW